MLNGLTKILTLALLFGDNTSARRLSQMDSEHSVEPIELLSQVAARDAKCTNALTRLKAGPANPAKILGTGKKYTDDTFGGDSAIHDGREANEFSGKTIVFKRWSEMPDYKGFTVLGADDNTPMMNEASQGQLGNCYFVSAMSAAAEFPELIQNMFVNKEKNDEGLYLIRFFIRGKPWVVSIDDYLVTENNHLILTQPSDGAMWAPLLEKAWAKVKGTYSNTALGFMATGFRAITGVPSEMTALAGLDAAKANAVFAKMLKYDKEGYLMGASTDGSNHFEKNACNIAEGHAYSVTSVFELDLGGGKKQGFLMIRNPWGVTYYKGDWDSTDKRWTDALVKQIPYGVDPRTSNELGFFFLPKEKLAGGPCISGVIWAFLRDDEGYVGTWYDYEKDQDSTWEDYTFKVATNTDDIYVTVESYYSELIPSECSRGNIAYTDAWGNKKTEGGTTNKLYYKVEQGGVRLGSTYVYEQFASPVILKAGSYKANQELKIRVIYEYFFSDYGHEYTVKLYSKDKNAKIKDKDGKSNMIHMDG